MSTIPNTLPYGGDIVKDYVDNRLKKKADKDEVKISTSASSTSFALTDAANAPLAGLLIEGNSRKSRNLFDKNDPYSTNGKFLNENGLTSSDANWAYTDYIPVSGVSIAMSYNATDVGNTPSICFYDMNKMYISGAAYHNNHSIIIPIPNNAAYCRASFYQTWIDTFQLELGSEPTSYEPYGIISVGDNGLSVTACGKNLINPQNLEVGYYDQNGYNSFSSFRTSGLIAVRANTSYSSAMFDGSGNSLDTTVLTEWTANEDFIKQTLNVYTIQTTTDTAYIRVRNLSDYNSYIDNNNYAFQLELGSTATAYEAYKGSTAALSTGLPLCSVGDIKDELDEKRGVVIKRCEKVVLDGSSDENWVVSTGAATGASGSKYIYMLNNPPVKYHSNDNLPNAISTLTLDTPDNMYTAVNDNVICVGDETQQDKIMVRIAGISTAADLKTYLASNPVTVVYELAELYELPLSVSEISQLHNLRTFSGTTNITCTDSPQMALDYMLNTENGTSVGQVAENMAGFINSLAFVWNTPEMHRMIFRGKYLGDHVTAAQLAAIRNGSFDDLYVGDYWIIGGVKWRIVDIDYWLYCGDTAFNAHHLVIVPDTCLYLAKMNDTNTTTGGYVGSKMYTENLTQAKTTINSLFVDMVLSHRELFTNAVTNGKPTAGAWFDSTIDLMNESMVYGHTEFTPANDGTTVPYNYTIDKSQLALFQIAPKFITNRINQWLRDVVSASGFARVNGSGHAVYAYASESAGVRPVFAIG